MVKRVSRATARENYLPRGDATRRVACVVGARKGRRGEESGARAWATRGGEGKNRIKIIIYTFFAFLARRASTTEAEMVVYLTCVFGVPIVHFRLAFNLIMKPRLSAKAYLMRFTAIRKCHIALCLLFRLLFTNVEKR